MSNSTAAMTFFQGAKAAQKSNGGNGGEIAQTFAAGGGVGTLGNQAAAMATRHAQEVQAAILMAKMSPRNQMLAYDRIMQACQRFSLAESAIYSYPRGGQKIEGPSIRLAEVIAQNWGNIEFGTLELEQREGESVMMAYAWDLETLTRAVKVFTVVHSMKANGRIKQLEDPRDIYEIGANQGARRLRAAILAIIPGDIVEAAVEACNKTMALGSGSVPLKDRIHKMVEAFREQGVTVQDLEVRMGHSLESMTERELAGLRKVWASINDGFGKKSDFFKPTDLESPLESKPEPPAKPKAAKSKPKAEPDPIQEWEDVPEDPSTEQPGILEILKTEKLDPALVAYVLRNMERPWLGKDQPIENLKPEMVDMISNNIGELRRKVADLTADEIDIAIDEAMQQSLDL